MGIWSKVIVVAAYALVVFVGQWPAWVNAATAVLLAAVLVYLSYRERAGFSLEFVRGNLLYLAPGHALLLFGMALAGAFDMTMWLVWVALVAATIGFDWVVQRRWAFGSRRGAAMALYAVVWGAIFVLVYWLIGAGGKLDEGGMLALGVALALIALAYIGLALYRFSKLNPIEE